MWNGSSSQVLTFKNLTGVTYPLCLSASSVGAAYGVPQDYSFVIDQAGIIRYKAPNVNISAITTKIDELLAALESGNGPPGSNQLQLHQNFPNPFNPSTTISFVSPAVTHITLSIHDANGHLVKNLVNGDVDEGPQEVTWDGKNARGYSASSGVYFYRLKMGSKILTKKMVLVK